MNGVTIAVRTVPNGRAAVDVGAMPKGYLRPPLKQGSAQQIAPERLQLRGDATILDECGMGERHQFLECCLVLLAHHLDFALRERRES